MVFTDRDLWTGFENVCDGLLDLDKIESHVCDDVPQEMRAKIAQVYGEARGEVGGRPRQRRIPGKRR